MSGPPGTWRNSGATLNWTPSGHLRNDAAAPGLTGWAPGRGYNGNWHPPSYVLLPVQSAGRSRNTVSCQARVVKLADTQDLGSCAFGRGGSSPPLRTFIQRSRAPRPGISAFNPMARTDTESRKSFRSTHPFRNSARIPRETPAKGRCPIVGTGHAAGATSAAGKKSAETK